MICALSSPPRGYRSAPPPEWSDLDVDPADLVVIVGGVQLGAVRLVTNPLRDGARQRAVGGGRAGAGMDHWPGQVGGRPHPRAGTTRRQAIWSTKNQLVERYHDGGCLTERVGIREFVDDGAIDPDHASPLLVSVFL